MTKATRSRRARSGSPSGYRRRGRLDGALLASRPLRRHAAPVHRRRRRAWRTRLCRRLGSARRSARPRGPALLLRAAGAGRDEAAQILLLLASHGPARLGRRGRGRRAPTRIVRQFPTSPRRAKCCGCGRRPPPIAPASPGSRPARAAPPRPHERRRHPGRRPPRRPKAASSPPIRRSPPCTSRPGGAKAACSRCRRSRRWPGSPRRLGITISRAAIAADGEQDLDLWVPRRAAGRRKSRLPSPAWAGRPAQSAAAAQPAEREADFLRAAAD